MHLLERLSSAFGIFFSKISNCKLRCLRGSCIADSLLSKVFHFISSPDTSTTERMCFKIQPLTRNQGTRCCSTFSQFSLLSVTLAAVTGFASSCHAALLLSLCTLSGPPTATGAQEPTADDQQRPAAPARRSTPARHCRCPQYYKMCICVYLYLFIFVVVYFSLTPLSAQQCRTADGQNIKYNIDTKMSSI